MIPTDRLGKPQSRRLLMTRWRRWAFYMNEQWPGWGQRTRAALLKRQNAPKADCWAPLRWR